MQITTSSSNGSYTIDLVLHTTGGRGLSGYLSGGTAHVGGVAYAVPQPKIGGDGLTADISTICGPGHKDVYAAQKVAQRLCVATNEAVCICAGIHIDNATKEEIGQLLFLCLDAADRALQQYLEEKEQGHV